MELRALPVLSFFRPFADIEFSAYFYCYASERGISTSKIDAMNEYQEKWQMANGKQHVYRIKTILETQHDVLSKYIAIFVAVIASSCNTGTEQMTGCRYRTDLVVRVEQEPNYALQRPCRVLWPLNGLREP